jgi:hypothetical protein
MFPRLTVLSGLPTPSPLPFLVLDHRWREPITAAETVRLPDREDLVNNPSGRAVWVGPERADFEVSVKFAKCGLLSFVFVRL